jgi:aspartyl-tRNA(Asn)/glutamyl-tRNA(Gln) amidotransferase subunit C
MSNLNKDTIHYLATLSRIATSDEEEEGLLGDLTKILNLVEELSGVDTDEVEPTLHVFPHIVNVTREDEVKEPLDRATFLDNAPSHTGGMVRVPTILIQ